MKTPTNQRYLRYLDNTEHIIKENKETTVDVQLSKISTFNFLSRSGLARVRFKPKLTSKRTMSNRPGFNFDSIPSPRRHQHAAAFSS